MRYQNRSTLFLWLLPALISIRPKPGMVLQPKHDSGRSHSLVAGMGLLLLVVSSSIAAANQGQIKLAADANGNEQCLVPYSVWDGALIHVYPCHGGGGMKEWQSLPTGEIANALDPDYCLITGNGALGAGTMLLLGRCTSPHAIKWAYIQGGQLQPDNASTVCVTADTHTHNRNATLQACENNSQQQWLETAAIPRPAMEIQARNGGNCLAPTSQADVVMSGCDRDPQQGWELSGSGQLMNMGDRSVCASLWDATLPSGALVYMQACTQFWTQLWRRGTNGQIHVDAAPHLCLDSGDGSVGARVTVKTCDGSDGQNWHSRAAFPFPPSFEIKNTKGTGCLQWDRNNNHVNTESCDGASVQNWRLLENGDILNLDDPTYCLDIYYANFAVGTPVNVYHCNGTDAQKWIYTADGKLQPSADQSLCVDSGDALPGARLTLQSCSDSEHQKWQKSNGLTVPESKAISTSNGVACLEPHAIENSADVVLTECGGFNKQEWELLESGHVVSTLDTTYCLDVDWGRFQEGTNVKLAKCHDDPAQIWSYAPDKTLRPIAASQFCLDGNGGKLGASARIMLCNGSGPQQWDSVDARTNDRWTKIYSKTDSSLCIHMQNEGNTAGTNVHRFPCSGGSEQQWFIMSSGEIRAGTNMELCLDLANNSYQNGANIQIAGCNGTDAQKWFLTDEGYLKPRATINLCLDTDGSSWAGNIFINNCDGRDSQKWAAAEWAPEKLLNKGGLRIKHSGGLCLQPVGHVVDGARMYVNHCAHPLNALSQEWFLSPDGMMRSMAQPELCLAHPAAGYTSVRITHCNAADTHQKWHYTPSKQLRSMAQPNRCIRSTGAPGATADLVACGSDESFEWTSTKALSAARWGQITPKNNTGLCIHLQNGVVSSPINTHLYSCNAETYQKWVLTEDGEIRNAVDPNICLDVDYARFVPGTNVKAYRCNGDQAQKWWLKPNGELSPKAATNVCLESSNSRSGDNIYLASCDGGDNQLWASNEGAFAAIQWKKIKLKSTPDHCITAANSRVEIMQCSSHPAAQYWRVTPKLELRSAWNPNVCLQAPGHDQGDFTTPFCNGSNEQKFGLDQQGRLRTAFGWCMSSNIGGGVKTQSCDNSESWVSDLFHEVSLQYIEGIYTLVYSQGGEKFGVTNPGRILQVLYVSGYTNEMLTAVAKNFSDRQKAILERILVAGQHTDVQALARSELNQDKEGIAEVLDISGPDAQFDDDADLVNARMEMTLVEARLQHGQSTVEFTAFKVTSGASFGSGGADLTVGVELASAGIRMGSESTYLGLGVGAGIGLEVGARFGRNGMYGFTLGLKFVTFHFYVGQNDVVKAFRPPRSLGSRCIRGVCP